MNTFRFSLLVAALLLAVTATSNAQDKPKKTFLSALKEGQTIVLKENAGKYEITVMKDVRLGHTVIEVGPDYVVVEDVAKVSEIRIPVFSIKAIVKITVPK
jgi:ABC-type enterochelin transport system substrate-binding protein